MRSRHLELEPFSRVQKVQKRVWAIGAVCSTLPDIDVVGFRFGIGYGDFCGHRGFPHSLLFASSLAALALVVGFPHAWLGLNRAGLWQYFFVATASYGFLHAMTNGGLGVAFFSPFGDVSFFLDTPSWLRRYRSRDFSAGVARRCCEVNLFGSGFRPGCWQY
jgi:membrane-bound metal-dependent hydrolase YbcI (DUF457 family)